MHTASLPTGITTFFCAMLASLLLAAIPALAEDEAEREQHQAQLDASCEAARQKRLKPLREQYTRECVREGIGDEAYCTTFYADYGARSYHRAALFYDLPECEHAYDYQMGRVDH